MRNLLLSTVTLLVVPAVSVAAPEFNTHTHTTPIELRPISQLDKAYKTAGICFLGVGDCAPEVGFSSGGDDDGDYDVNTGNQCLNEGFSKQSCNSVQTIDGVCPYNSAYGRGCKCVSNLISCPAGQVGVGDSCDGKYASCKCDPNLKTCSSKEVGQGASCGGRYESCVCKSEYQYTSSNCTYPYQYTSSNCTYPRSVSGDNCSGKYTNCVCPTGVSSTPYGCEEYYPAPCSSVCKVAYADNCRNRDSVSTPYGCVEYWSDCSSKCKTAYNDNCRNRTAVTCQFGCASSFADCQSKCEKCKTDNCDNRTNQSCQYGCQTYWSDCSSKCQTCYSDNCRNVTAVSVPANATCTSYYSDCSSKCSAWSCNSGYKQSGNSCVIARTCKYEYLYVTDEEIYGCYSDSHNPYGESCSGYGDCFCKITCSDGYSSVIDSWISLDGFSSYEMSSQLGQYCRSHCDSLN